MVARAGLLLLLAVCGVTHAQVFVGRATTVAPNTPGSCVVRRLRRTWTSSIRTYQCYKTTDIDCADARELELRGNNEGWCYWRWSESGFCTIRELTTCRRTEFECKYVYVKEYKCCNGYESDGRGGCRAIVECKLNNGGCEQECHPNRDCKYGNCERRRCSCYKGYIANGNRCEDIDECFYNNGGCSHNCHNTNGSHTCSCKNGFRLNRDGLGCTEINECETMNGRCAQQCHNTPGAFYCTCLPGFKLVQGFRCVDRDECAEQFCSHNCTNHPGGYRCSCPPGYSLRDKQRTCTPDAGTDPALPHTVDGAAQTDHATLAGAIAGGVLGLLGLLALIILLVLLLLRYRRKYRAAGTSHIDRVVAENAANRATNDPAEYNGYMVPGAGGGAGVAVIAKGKLAEAGDAESLHPYSNLAFKNGVYGRDTIKQQKPLPPLPPPAYDNPPGYEAVQTPPAEPVYDNGEAARQAAMAFDNKAYAVSVKDMITQLNDTLPTLPDKKLKP